MNKARRNTLSRIKEDLEAIMTDLTTERDAEQESFDNMSEGLQQTETGQAIERAADALDGAVSSLEEVTNQIDEAIE